MSLSVESIKMIDYFMGIKLQIAEICFMIIILVNYHRSRKLNMLINRCFKLLLNLMVVYLIADMATAYTIVNMPDSDINLIVHKIFYVLMISVVFIFAIYLEILGNERIAASKKQLLITSIYAIPYFVCAVGCMVSPFYCVVDDVGFYSLGTAVYFVYACIAFYLLSIMIETVRYKNQLTRIKKSAYHMIFLAWSIIFIIQAYNPYLLLSGLALSVGVFVLYITSENPALYTDEFTGAYNEKAFKQFFFEECNRMGRKSFYLVSVVLEDSDIVMEGIGGILYERVLQILVDRITDALRCDVFKISNHILSFKVDMSQAVFVESCMRVKALMLQKVEVEGTTIQPKTHILVCECPKVVRVPEEVIDMLNLDVNNTNEYVRFIREDIKDIIARKSTLLKMVKDAVDNDGFEVFYQPIYSTQHKKFVSCEALVRLKDNNTLGYVSPEEFVPIAEDNGLVINLGETVFRKVCDTIVDFRDRGLRLDYVEVNLSTLQMINSGVTESFIRIMDEHQLNAKSLNLEVTETAAVESSALFEQNMKRYRTVGCTFSMDDFGTGYSNLATMADMPYDIVKIDKSLLWPVFDGNEKTRVILKSTIKMLKDLGLRIVAEGVETKEMVDFLIENGVDFLQGFYFSRPVPKEKYYEFLMNPVEL